MNEIFENVLFDNISGNCALKDGGLLFTVSDNVYKWYFSSWIRSEKSKKTCKVRLTFKENSVRLAGNSSLNDVLIKPVIVVDFGEDRNRLEDFCSLVSVETNKTKILSSEASVQGDQTPDRSSVSISNKVTQGSKHYELKRDKDELTSDQKLLLESNPALLKLYNKFINTDNHDIRGNISFSDFWNHHKLELISCSSQPKGVSNLDGFVSVPPNSNLVDGQNVYNYSKELTSALLAEDDTIRNLHTKLVINKQYPADNFWKRILQSYYFYNLIGEKIPTNQILYEDIKGIPIRKTVNRINQTELNNVDLNSNLLSTNDYNKVISKNKYEKIYKNFRNNNKEEPILLDRFNRHSFNIIDSCDSQVKNNELKHKVENERKKNITSVNYNDLEDISDTIDERCVIKMLKMPDTSGVKSDIDNQGYGRWIEELKNFDIVKYIKNYEIDSSTSRRMFVLNTKLCQSEKLVQLVPFEYDPYTVERMKDIQLQIIEVLQMYYKTLMPEEDKRSKLINLLKSIKQNLESLQDVGLSAHTSKALQSGLLDQINALENYDNKLKDYVASLRSQHKSG